MPRTLAEFAAGRAPFATRLRVAGELARLVAALHRRGALHGTLSPVGVLVAGDGDAVALAPPGPPGPLPLAGWAAPELVRGSRATRAADAFATAALCQLALTGCGPFDGGGADPLERARRVLFEAPRPARLDAPEIPAEVEEVLARLLERSARRRGTAEELARAFVAAEAPAAAPSSSSSSSPSSSTSTTPIRAATAGAAARARGAALRASASAGVAVLRGGASVGRALARRIPPSPLHRAALAALPLLLVAAVALPRSDASLAREVGDALAAGDLGAARAALDAAPRTADRALVEKLRGDLACARRAPDECLRRYRTALAARPELRGDRGLRQNVRALLSRREACGTQRSAALLAGQLRDPEALPALQAARQSAGFFGFLCAGDAFDRAIAATRAAAP